MARTFTIDSEIVFVNKNWRVSDRINSRTTANFTVVDLQNLDAIDIGDEINILDGVEVLFAGTVETVNENEAYPGQLEYDVTAVDFSALADKRLIADSIVNTLAGDIIRDNILPILADEGVIAGNISDGPELKKAVFNYDKGSTALDYIKDATGLNWNINFSKELNFFKRNENSAPFDLTDSIFHSRFKRNRTRNQYRNTQFIRAGKGRTTTQNLEKPSPKPDGVSRNFVLRFPVAEKPILYINSDQVNENDVGINGLDKNKKFYFSFGSNIISQDTSQTELSSEILEITYVGLFPILVKADNPDEIANRKNKETGTSGIYETLNTETSINESQQALQYSQGLLDKYGMIPSTVSFQTETPGLKAGQLLKINKPLYGINDNFLIESVDASSDGTSTVFNIKCLDGSSLGGWEEFFKTMLKGQRILVIGENEVLILLNVQRENAIYNGSYQIEPINFDTPDEDLYPADDYYSIENLTGVSIDD